ncbi:MAG: hypothetical protein OEY33_01720 [Bdellovibrionales bacterium]|nr:hypothetical protein [Bdellovibrionales bacterium]
MILRLICLTIIGLPFELRSSILEVRFQNLYNLSPLKDIERVKLIRKQDNSGISIFAFSELMSKHDEHLLLQSLGGDLLIRSKKSFQSLGVIIKGVKFLEQIKVWELDEGYKRPILMLEILLKTKKKIHVFVNHWPSQRWKSKKRILYLKKIKKILPLLTTSKVIIIGDFNTNKHESLQLEKALSQFQLSNPLLNEPTYYFSPFGKLYHFDQIWLRGFKVVERFVNKKYSRKMLINNKEVKVPDKKYFDHFELYLKLSID